VNQSPEVDELIVPGLDLTVVERRVDAFARSASSRFFCFTTRLYSASVLRKPGLIVTTPLSMKRLRWAGFAPDDLHLLERKDEHIQIGDVAHERLSLAVHVQLFRGFGKQELKLLGHGAV
jgi:hypothetical protein